MGVTHLWSILGPVAEHRTLDSLAGQTLAVDLSMWICEQQGVRQMQGTVTRPYLRNLFFRISHLTQIGVKLVFVIEGEAPELKWETMGKRQQTRNGRRPPANTNRPVEIVRKKKRSHFKGLIRQCCEMLDHLGIPFVQSYGEAEAMCAFLNKHGLVDACITEDGDAFVYGARKVYRNFTMNTKDPHVESYSAEDIRDRLGLDQERLVALALLLGCDYVPKGVPGIGKEQAIRLINALQDAHILQRFRDWPYNKELERLTAVASVKKMAHCATCGHPGSAKSHVKNGCKYCNSEQYCEPKDYSMECSCPWHQAQRHLAANAAEISVRKKALEVQGFPNEKVIEEFLLPKDKVPKKSFNWVQPNLPGLQKFNLSSLEWPEEYTTEKVMPLITIWLMRKKIQQHPVAIATEDILTPHCIVKKRVRQGIPCYEIEWNKLVGDTVTEADFYTTIEEQQIIQQCYPQLVHTFQEKLLAKKPRKKGKKAAKTCSGDAQDSSQGGDVEDLDSLASQVHSLSLLDSEQNWATSQADPSQAGHLHTEDLVSTVNGSSQRESSTKAKKTSVKNIHKIQKAVSKDSNVEDPRNAVECPMSGNRSGIDRGKSLNRCNMKNPLKPTSYKEGQSAADTVTEKTLVIPNFESDDEEEELLLPLSQRLRLRSQQGQAFDLESTKSRSRSSKQLYRPNVKERIEKRIVPEKNIIGQEGSENSYSASQKTCGNSGSDKKAPRKVETLTVHPLEKELCTSEKMGNLHRDYADNLAIPAVMATEAGGDCLGGVTSECGANFNNLCDGSKSDECGVLQAPLTEHTSVVDEHADSISKQADNIFKLADNVHTHTDSIEENAIPFDEHADSFNEHASDFVCNADISDEHTGFVEKHTGIIIKPTDDVAKPTGKHSNIVEKPIGSEETQYHSVGEQSNLVSFHDGNMKGLDDLGSKHAKMSMKPVNAETKRVDKEEKPVFHFSKETAVTRSPNNINRDHDAGIKRVETNKREGEVSTSELDDSCFICDPPEAVVFQIESSRKVSGVEVDNHFTPKKNGDTNMPKMNKSEFATDDHLFPLGIPHEENDSVVYDFVECSRLDIPFQHYQDTGNLTETNRVDENMLNCYSRVGRLTSDNCLDTSMPEADKASPSDPIPSTPIAKQEKFGTPKTNGQNLTDSFGFGYYKPAPAETRPSRDIGNNTIDSDIDYSKDMFETSHASSVMPFRTPNNQNYSIASSASDTSPELQKHQTVASVTQKQAMIGQSPGHVTNNNLLINCSPVIGHTPGHVTNNNLHIHCSPVIGHTPCHVTQNNSHIHCSPVIGYNPGHVLGNNLHTGGPTGGLGSPCIVYQAPHDTAVNHTKTPPPIFHDTMIRVSMMDFSTPQNIGLKTNENSLLKEHIFEKEPTQANTWARPPDYTWSPGQFGNFKIETSLMSNMSKMSLNTTGCSQLSEQVSTIEEKEEDTCSNVSQSFEPEERLVEGNPNRRLSAQSASGAPCESISETTDIHDSAGEICRDPVLSRSQETPGGENRNLDTGQNKHHCDRKPLDTNLVPNRVKTLLCSRTCGTPSGENGNHNSPQGTHLKNLDSDVDTLTIKKSVLPQDLIGGQDNLECVNKENNNGNCLTQKRGLPLSDQIIVKENSRSKVATPSGGGEKLKVSVDSPVCLADRLRRRLGTNATALRAMRSKSKVYK